MFERLLRFPIRANGNAPLAAFAFAFTVARVRGSTRDTFAFDESLLFGGEFFTLRNALLERFDLRFQFIKPLLLHFVETAILRFRLFVESRYVGNAKLKQLL